RSPSLLFAGTEFGLFASLDGGGRWQPLRNGLPAVAVHDLVLHPRDRELVIATHGRSLWVLDVAPLEPLRPEVLGLPAFLCDVKPATSFDSHYGRKLTGGRLYAANNPEYGAALWYYFKDRPTEPVRLTISDGRGRRIDELKVTAEAGLHRVVWDL